MGREVRMVPPAWEHPKYPQDDPEEYRRGRYIPLFESGYAEAAAKWDEGWAKWQAGLTENYGGDEKWAPIEPKYAGMRYTDYAGSRPSPDDYMPDWAPEQRTHFMMYEDTSEDTPKSPAFATAEELARWLADTGASAFGDSTASYDEWLSTIRRGWAPSAIIQGGVMRSGVEGLA